MKDSLGPCGSSAGLGAPGLHARNHYMAPAFDTDGDGDGGDGDGGGGGDGDGGEGEGDGDGDSGEGGWRRWGYLMKHGRWRSWLGR